MTGLNRWQDWIDGIYRRWVSEGRRSERASGGVKNGNVLVATERISTRKINRWQDWIDGIYCRWASEGRRSERALSGSKNEWFDTELQLEKFQLLALLAHFEYYRDGIRLSIKPWEDTAGGWAESAAVMFSHRPSHLEFSRWHKASIMYRNNCTIVDCNNVPQPGSANGLLPIFRCRSTL